MRASLLATAGLAALAASACAAGRPPPGPSGAGPARAAGAAAPPRPGALDGEGVAALVALVAAPRLPDLAWEDVRTTRDAVRRLYASRGWELAWTRDGRATPQARAVVRALQASADDGLEPRDYDAADWEARLDALELPAPATAAERIRFDVLLTISAMRWIADLDGARGAPAAAPGRPGDRTDPAALLAGVVESDDADAALAAAHPPAPAYALTLRAYRRYRQLARASEDVPRLRAASGPLPAGAAGATLARWLWQLGDLPADAEPRAGVPPAVLAEAVARFQRRHGIAPSGELDPRTVRALDVPLARRAEQLALALERWRSLPRRAGAPPVVVTLPELRVRVPGATPPLSLRAAAGAACERLTSTFAGEIGRVVLRPASRSARGVVELVFPNPHAVTLSGTAGDEPPDRARPETARACLHVERADELAAWLLRDEPTKDGAPPWSAERVRRALSGGGRTDVTLTHPAPVLVVHTAAVVSDDGAVLFLEGGARGDAALAEALAREEARRGGR